MQRYFVPQENWGDHQVTITGEDVHHIRKVMRMKEDDELIVVSPEQRSWRAVIRSFSEGMVVCETKEEMKEEKELPQHITIIQSLGKADKVEWVIQKATELGVHTIIPFQADRSVVKWDEKKQAKKVERFRKIAKEAAEQSERLILPEVNDITGLNGIIEVTSNYDYRFFAYEHEARKEKTSGFSQEVKRLSPGAKVCMVIGPEGGFSPDEATTLTEAGFLPVRLGKRILRMETAPLYFLSALSYEWEE